MFPVARYDPRKEDKEEKKRRKEEKKRKKKERKKEKKREKKESKKRKREKADDDEHENKKISVVEVEHVAHPKRQQKEEEEDEEAYVIAPKAQAVPTTAATARNHHQDKIQQEAFDDLELMTSTAAENDKKPAAQADRTTTTTTTTSNDDGDDYDPIAPPHGKEEHNADKDDKESQEEIEIRRALEMSNLPLREAATKWQLAPFLVNNLEEEGIENFFPIQALVIPDIMASERHSYVRAQDICVSSPTGSGKTLAFVLPTLNALATRQIKRLRALVVLPSRDLAQQVYAVFKRYARGSDLAIGLAIGKTDFKREQMALMVDAETNDADAKGAQTTTGSSTMEMMHVKEDDNDPPISQIELFLAPGNPNKAASEAIHYIADDAAMSSVTQAQARGGKSAVDVLVCTPGRLVDHLDNTPGFTLQHLRFLVVDEADRLISQSYHNWINRVMDSANAASIQAWHYIEEREPEKEYNEEQQRALPPPARSDPITWRRGGKDGDYETSSYNTNESYNVVANVCQPKQLRKLLYSATLTRDPQKLASLRLLNPKHYSARQFPGAGVHGGRNKYTMPLQLQECTLECTAEQKPMVLLALVLEHLNINNNNKNNNNSNNQQQQEAGEDTGGSQQNVVVVFTSSVESTHRLTRLLQLLWKAGGYGLPSEIAEYSRSLSQRERTNLIRQCRNQQQRQPAGNASNDDGSRISVVVCSDGMSRGMDLHAVGTVINYDVPMLAKTYVHRCGRTARAEKRGTAITLLKGGGQMMQFQKMRQIVDPPTDRVATFTKIQKRLVKGVVRVYKKCLKTLGQVLAAENGGDFKSTDPIPEEMMIP